MIRRVLPLLAAALACAGAHASESMPDAAGPVVGHLACGGANLTATTVFREVADQDRQILSQTITIAPAGKSASATLKLEARRLRQPFLRDTLVLDASATGWACVKATDGKPYVYVMMTCTESPLRPACEGATREWMALYDLSGRELNAGLPHDGRQEAALIKRLKLEHLDDGSVTLSSPGE